MLRQPFAAAVWLLVLPLLIGQTCGSSSSSSPPPTRLEPSSEAARQNAFAIFNAVHSLMRQWGTAVHHNGMSVVPVTVPAGNLFYHGALQAERRTGFEWLAFEPEHAAVFARSWPGRKHTRPPPGEDPDGGDGGQQQQQQQQPLGGPDAQAQKDISTFGRQSEVLGAFARHEHQPHDNDDDDDDDDDKPSPPFDPRPDEPMRGYLHTYRAARPLNLLLIDGMSAAKCPLGPMDTQDLLLLELPFALKPPGYIHRESERAAGLCRLARETWGGAVDGFIRNEAGFEIVFCDFAPGGGLDLAGVRASPWPNETRDGGDETRGDYFRLTAYEWLRAVGQRYAGFPRGRVQVHHSRMLSALWYPVNVTNPDRGRAELPRLVNTTAAERAGMRARVAELVAAADAAVPSDPVDWQGVADAVVSRFAPRLRHLARGRNLTLGHVSVELATLLDPFIDYEARPAEEGKDSSSGGGGDDDDDDDEWLAAAAGRCARHHLEAAHARRPAWTREDALLAAALGEVTGAVCGTLFEVRRALVAAAADADGEDEEDVLGRLQAEMRGLVDRLAWATFKECGGCDGPGEMCFVAMFPIGGEEDHYAPRCKGAYDIDSTKYWVDEDIII